MRANLLTESCALPAKYEDNIFSVKTSKGYELLYLFKFQTSN